MEDYAQYFIQCNNYRTAKKVLGTFAYKIASMRTL